MRAKESRFKPVNELYYLLYIYKYLMLSNSENTQDAF